MIATIDDDADRAFMTRIYYRYRRYMYKTIGTFVSDPWDADDIFQTTLPAQPHRPSGHAEKLAEK